MSNGGTRRSHSYEKRFIEKVAPSIRILVWYPRLSFCL